MNDLLNRAKVALKAGHTAEARQMLIQLIQQDQRNEEAWLWLSATLDKVEDRRRCLEQILAINPGNDLAKRGLDILRSGAPSEGRPLAQRPAPQPAAVPSPASPEPSPTQDEGSESVPAEHESSDVSVPGRPRRRGLAIALSTLAFASILLTIAVVVVPLLGDSDDPPPEGPTVPTTSTRQTALQPVDSTAPPTWTPVPRPTRTPTPQPTQTVLATLEPTGVGFAPGDPTATPPGEYLVDPNYLLGKAAYEAEEYEQVLTLMSRVIEAAPDLAPPHWYRGMAYFYLGDYVGGLYETEFALALDPEYALAYADRGLMYAAMGDYGRALADWERALELDPSLAKVHHNLGVMYFNQGDYLRALDAYNMALAIDPTRTASFYERGETLIYLGWYQECLDTAQDTLEQAPEFWVAYFIRGACKSLVAWDAAALEDFLIYVDAVPDDPLGWFNLGMLYNRMGNTALALDNYDRGIELDPVDPSQRYNRALIYMELEEYGLAITDLDVVLSQGEFMDARSARGTAHFHLGHYEQAIADLQAYSAQEPDRVITYAYLSRAYFAQERLEQAILAATKGVAIEAYTVSTPVCYVVRGWAYLELGDHARAIEDLSAALEFLPSTEAYYYRGIAYEASGQTEQATRDFALCIQVHTPGDGMDTEVQDAQARLNRSPD